MQSKKTLKKLTVRVASLIFIIVCLCVITFAMVMSEANVENNKFNTGKIEINLNDGKPIIEETEYIFEPGVTVQKEFFVENNSTWDVWYRIYFDNVNGMLAEEIDAVIYDGNEVLWKGSPKELNNVNVAAADESLAPGEKKTLLLEMHLPATKTNSVQNMDMSFDILSEAVQTKNNPEKLFD